ATNEARSSRATPMQEPSPSATSTSLSCRDTAISAMRAISSAIRSPVPNGAAGTSWLGGLRQAQAGQQTSDAVGARDEQHAEAALGVLPHPLRAQEEGGVRD